jgi:putative membrane protein
MKLFGNQINVNAKSKIALALCTMLALSASALRADDDKGSKGGAGNDSTTTSGRSSSLSRSDEKFIKDAAHGGWMEVQMGKLGLQKSQNDQVKQFSQKLIDDHSKANAELKQIAATKGVTLPDPDKLAGTGSLTDSDRTQVREKSDADSDMHGEMKKLQGLSGTEFDRAFAKMAVKDHEKDISEFEKASKKTQDTELKAWIDKTLPTLREHLTQSQSLQSSSTGGASSQSGADTGSKSSKSSTSDTK